MQAQGWILSSPQIVTFGSSLTITLILFFKHCIEILFALIIEILGTSDFVPEASLMLPLCWPRLGRQSF